jgi:uncharacterized membrane protein
MAKRVTRMFLGVIGLGLLAVGATKISVTTGNADATALILAGALLIVSPFIIDLIIDPVEQYLIAALFR